MSGHVVQINKKDKDMGKKLYEASAFDRFVAKNKDSHVKPAVQSDPAGFKAIKKNECDETVLNNTIDSNAMTWHSDEHSDEDNKFETKEECQSDEELQV